MFERATRNDIKLRMALLGPSGGGKTYTAMRIARGIVGDEGRIAVIDTERGSARKYSDLTAFDVVELTSFEVQHYIDGIEAAVDAGYTALIIDSLSHAWAGPGGLLEFVDNKKRQNTNNFTAWRDATPLHNKLIDAILGADIHIIITMRTKMEYVVEKDERTGKAIPKKIGMQPVQRDGLEYEFDVIGDIDLGHYLTISKTRCTPLTDKSFHKAGEDIASILRDWLGAGDAVGRPLPSLPTPSPTPAPQPAPKPNAKPTKSQERKEWLDNMASICADAGGGDTVKARLKAHGCSALKDATPGIMAMVTEELTEAMALAAAE